MSDRLPEKQPRVLQITLKPSGPFSDEAKQELRRHTHVEDLRRFLWLSWALSIVLAFVALASLFYAHRLSIAIATGRAGQAVARPGSSNEGTPGQARGMGR